MTSSSAVSININHVPATQPTSHSYKRFNWKHPIHTKDSTENTSFIQKSQLSAKQHYVEEQKEEIRRYGLCSQVTSFKETPSFHIKHLYSLKREKYLDLSSQLFLVLRMTSYLAAILTDTLDYWSFIKNHLFLHLEKNKDRSRSTAEEQTPALSLTSCPWEASEPLCHHRKARWHSMMALPSTVSSKVRESNHHTTVSKHHCYYSNKDNL